MATGRVLAVEKFDVRLDRPFNSNPSAAVAPRVGGFAAAGAMFIGRALAGSGVGYRHAIRMKSGEMAVFELDFAYKVGECLAFRQGLTSESIEDRWPIRALPGECEQG
jgi:hypothetical protein